ncbi:AAA family ATPase [Lyngbya confervoides]|uniref:MoxR family ATPase n=1 Tax=Lyngbya confervoides BDU141951 TaxID=1574623 RepID=A0ABD4T3R0_9CYAN|nr:MoxR family ATPase [Lyngbya confervoides]MCM1983204.1 MoxR family ATPase [Lyngbya confervoides BDU141951]
MSAPLVRLLENMNQAIVGKEEAVRLVLAALLSGGHALLEDVPGVGKTLLAKSLARSVQGRFHRVQCTPDLMPGDLTGTNIWNPQEAQFEFVPGPIFANVLLADEINRSTPRTQSALLEVMEEFQVTLDRVTHPVPQPFFVIATQNPIEYQGTFVLPEAQLDRFAVALSLGYPTAEQELQMLQRAQDKRDLSQLDPCISLQDVRSLQQATQQVRVAPPVQKYMLNLARATRDHAGVKLGISPRGVVTLQRTTQAIALLCGRDYALPDDVKFLAPYVLAHRMIPARGHAARDIIADLVDSLPVP